MKSLPFEGHSQSLKQKNKQPGRYNQLTPIKITIRKISSELDRIAANPNNLSQAKAWKLTNATRIVLTKLCVKPKEQRKFPLKKKPR